MTASTEIEQIMPRGTSPASLTVEIPLARIDPSPTNPRKCFAEESLQELADSIRDHGLIEPLVVRSAGERFTLVAGERRFRACRMAGLTTAPSRIIEVDDAEALRIQLIENLQRQDLDPIEEAHGYQQLHETLGLTQTAIAAAVNRSHSAVAHALRLLELPEIVQDHIREGRLSVAHGKALVKYATHPDACTAIAADVITENYTAKQVEAGFGYEGMNAYRLDVVVPVPYNLSEAARAGLTIWGNYTPDIEQVKALIATQERERKEREAAVLESARQAARAVDVQTLGEPETDEDGEPLPGRDPTTKNGRRRLAKDARKAERAAAEAAYPKLADLPFGSYERVESYNWPTSCGPDCECRAKAVDGMGKVVDISTRPRHVSALRGKEERLRKAAATKTALSVKDALEIALATAPAADARGLAVAVRYLIEQVHSYSNALDRDTVRKLLQQYAPEAYRDSGRIPSLTLDAYAEAGVENLLRFLVGVVLLSGVERAAKDALAVPREVLWYLGGGDEEPVAEAPPADDDLNAAWTVDEAMESLSDLEAPIEERRAAALFLHERMADVGDEEWMELIESYLRGEDPLAEAAASAESIPSLPDMRDDEALAALVMPGLPLEERAAAARLLRDRHTTGIIRDLGENGGQLVMAYMRGEDPLGEEAGVTDSTAPAPATMSEEEARGLAWRYLRATKHHMTRTPLRDTLNGELLHALRPMWGAPAEDGYDWPAIIAALTATSTGATPSEKYADHLAALETSSAAIAAEIQEAV